MRAFGADAPRHVAIKAAAFRSGPHEVIAMSLPAPLEVGTKVSTYFYLPFALDNQTLWNESQDQPALRRGVLTLMIATGDEPTERLDIPLEQEDGGPRSIVDRGRRMPPPRAPSTGPKPLP
jgi:hypothetical protein